MIRRLVNKIYYRIRCLLYTPEEMIRMYGGTVGHRVFIGAEVLIDYDYAFLLHIDDGAVIAARTIIELHDSALPNALGRARTKIGRVIIGRRAYIGVNSLLLPGTCIGEGAIVGACSLVNRKIPAGEVWVGCPVKFLCTVEELKEKRASETGIDPTMIAHFDWMGEIEKGNVNYPEVKAALIRRVRRYFMKAEED